MRFGTTRSQIYDAQKTARAKWDATGDEWDDAVRREHGEKVVEALDKSVCDVLAGDRPARHPVHARSARSASSREADPAASGCRLIMSENFFDRRAGGGGRA